MGETVELYFFEVRQVIGSMALSGFKLRPEDKQRILRSCGTRQQVEEEIKRLVAKHKG